MVTVHVEPALIEGRAGILRSLAKLATEPCRAQHYADAVTAVAYRTAFDTTAAVHVITYALKEDMIVLARKLTGLV